MLNRPNEESRVSMSRKKLLAILFVPSLMAGLLIAGLTL